MPQHSIGLSAGEFLMLCERCKQGEATVHLTQVIEGAVQKLHLCEKCAAESGFDLAGPVSITDILLGMSGKQPEKPAPATETAERTCPQCHLRRTDFKKMGRLGCPACYDAFADELAPLLKAVHHHDRHVGKTPGAGGGGLDPGAELAAIRKALEQAVADENYEAAARLRDQLQACRSRAEGRTREAAP